MDTLLPIVFWWYAVVMAGLLELMWARYSFEWFRLVFTRALIPCLTLRVLPQLTWIEEFPLVCSPILVLYPHTSKASITLQLLKVPLHHSKCVFLHVSCCCSNVRAQARALALLPFVRPTFKHGYSTDDKLNFASDWVN